MNKPRYILNSCNPIKIFNSTDSKSDFVMVDSNHKNPIYVDLFSAMNEGTCLPVKIRAYLKDGQVHVGYVVGFLIDIIHKDSMYDGRFNLLPE